MKCPFCGHDNTRVIDSRPAEDNNSIRRRRVCDECDKRPAGGGLPLMRKLKQFR